MHIVTFVSLIVQLSRPLFSVNLIKGRKRRNKKKEGRKEEKDEQDGDKRVDRQMDRTDGLMDGRRRTE
jgi:hypothetical protein